MKKLIALAMIGAAGAGAAVYAAHPEELTTAYNAVLPLLEKAWAGIEANPVPVLVALGTFVLTIIYHKAKGLSLRQSLEFAATRVTVVPVPAPQTETPVVLRAKARATRAQLIADQIALENRFRKLPAEVKAAEKDACYTEQAVADARKSLEAKQRAHEDAVAKLEELRAELAAGEEELAAIADELKKLAEVV